MRIRILDLETTGVEPDCHVVEIAAWDLLIDENVGVHFIPVGELFVRPPIEIPPLASAVHHITDEDVRGAAPWDAVAPVFVDDTVDAYCAHNAKFERQWLTPEIGFTKPWVCTYRCALRQWPQAPGHANQELRYWLKPERLSRGNAREAHRASADAYVTAHTLFRLLTPTAGEAHLDLPFLIEVSALPALLPRVPFGKHRGQPWTAVPEDYLHWIGRQADMSEDVKYTAAREIEQRRSDPF